MLGSRVDIVEEDAIARVAHSVEEYVVGNRTTQVEGKERRDVRNNADLEYAEALTTCVLGA